MENSELFSGSLIFPSWQLIKNLVESNLLVICLYPEFLAIFPYPYAHFIFCSFCPVPPILKKYYKEKNHNNYNVHNEYYYHYDYKLWNMRLYQALFGVAVRVLELNQASLGFRLYEVRVRSFQWQDRCQSLRRWRNFTHIPLQISGKRWSRMSGNWV